MNIANAKWLQDNQRKSNKGFSGSIPVVIHKWLPTWDDLVTLWPKKITLFIALLDNKSRLRLIEWIWKVLLHLSPLHRLSPLHLSLLHLSPLHLSLLHLSLLHPLWSKICIVNNARKLSLLDGSNKTRYFHLFITNNDIPRYVSHSYVIQQSPRPDRMFRSAPPSSVSLPRNKIRTRFCPIQVVLNRCALYWLSPTTSRLRDVRKSWFLR